MPLGIIKKNENKLDEMCFIMDEIHEFVPSRTTVTCYSIDDEEIEDGEVQAFIGETFHQILLGGGPINSCSLPWKCSCSLR